jgi:hypothetical protein
VIAILRHEPVGLAVAAALVVLGALRLLWARWELSFRDSPETIEISEELRFPDERRD